MMIITIAFLVHCTHSLISMQLCSCMGRNGAVHKARHARGGGVREGVTVCDRVREVQEHVTSRLQIFLSYI